MNEKHNSANSLVRKKSVSKKAAGREPSQKQFPIVGVGASAGGVEAFARLLAHLDPGLGMAYVLILHLSRNHKSALAQVVQSRTKMPVHTVTDGMEVLPNNIYVIPPNTYMSVVGGYLRLAPRASSLSGNFAVDYFLIALASAYRNNAIGVILSGTATDGTLGLKAIKAEGGITFAQDNTAKFPGMPDNAFESGFVDFRLSPEGIAGELARLVHEPYTKLPSVEIDLAHRKELDGHTDELRRLLVVVKNRFGVDFFTHYKHASVYRRVVRRMVLNKCESLGVYGEMLKSNPREVDALYNDFLINVTSFFRDAEFYELLVGEVFPAIAKLRGDSDPIRIWVAGCASGEEAYSITISLLEFIEQNGLSIPIQVFASDIDTNAIEIARLGIYPLSSLQGVSARRLRKFFTRTGDHYQIIKSVRELCIFSQHNLLNDPPFSRIDLVSCQNVLIYLETNPQTRVLQTFHFALRPNSYLFLGKSESIGANTDLFDQVGKKRKMFTRKSTKSPQLGFALHKAEKLPFGGRSVTFDKSDLEGDRDIGRLILSRYVPPCMVVDSNLMIVQFFGLVAPYLEPVSGKASLNVLKIIRADLVVHLGSLFQQARKTEQVVLKEGIVTEENKEVKEISIEVNPVKGASGDVLFVVVFKESQIVPPPTKGKGKIFPPDSKERKISKLEEQLTESRSLIRASNEEYETTYEELQAFNEEILSSNEELQSVNEELETSKEELQSAVEELSMTNEELRKRNVDLKQSQTYAKAIVETVHSPLLVLNADLEVRMANNAFYRTFKLTREETEGRLVFELGDQAWEIPSLHEQLNELLTKEAHVIRFELRHFFPALGQLVLEVNGYRLAWEDNANERLILLAFDDVSKLVAANHELKSVNEQLAEFAFISSHHLQEPLRKIQVFASCLAKPEASLNEFAREYLGKINTSSSRMSMLIRDLLSFTLLSRVERQLLTVDLNDTVKQVVSDFAETIEQKKAVVNMGPLPSIHADAARMTQMFKNLLGNALKFCREKPFIRISSEKTSDGVIKQYDLDRKRSFVSIQVQDNGIGFDQQYATKLFTIFQTLKNNDGANGSGIGLAICRKIVEDLGGVIRADGKENEGATFTIIIPE